jgi:hypothetical protein
MSVKWRVIFGRSLVVFCLIGWPVSQFWMAADEPPHVLALSWGALLLTAIDIAFTADVHKTTDKED